MPRPRRTARARSSRDRRHASLPLGAHPERRILAPARRAGLRGAGARTGDGRRPQAAVVLPPVVNLFERDDGGSPVVSQATLGSVVPVLARRGAWALVETPDHYRGWMRAEALRHLPEGRPSGRPSRRRAVEVRSLLAHIYPEPDVTSASPIAVAPFLSRLETVRRAGEWTRVRLPDRREGWMQRGDLAAPDAGSRGPSRAGPAAIVATAVRFLGLPYLWGGTTPFGLDCSGLTQLVYRAHGHLLPRDADLQFADPNLVEVPRSGVRAGDLVFFGPGGTSITHVGIALGPRAFVNATTYKRPVVRIDRLDDPYWRRLYRGARRLPDAPSAARSPA